MGAVSPEAPVVAPGPLSHRGWAFAAIWLVYLGYPLRAAWQHPRPATRLLALVALLVFGALFLAAFARLRSLRAAGGRTVVYVCAGGMLLLLALAEPAAGQQVLGGLIYVGVLLVMTLPTRPAVVGVAALVLAAELLGLVVPGWTPDVFFGFQLVVSAAAAWGITQVIERNVALARAREEIARLAVSDERARMARDLHDILGHSLTVITVKAELAGRLAEAEGATRTRAELADVERLARQALADVRATVGGVREVSLAGELVSARAALEASGITPDLPQAVDDVPAERRELFGWVVREGVTNVVRHSGARVCAVRLGPTWVEVLDDGRGPQECADTGHGLAGLRERVSAQLGVMTAGRRGADGGFRLRVEAP